MAERRSPDFIDRLPDGGDRRIKQGEWPHIVKGDYRNVAPHPPMSIAQHLKQPHEDFVACGEDPRHLRTLLQDRFHRRASVCGGVFAEQFAGDASGGAFLYDLAKPFRPLTRAHQSWRASEVSEASMTRGQQALGGKRPTALVIRKDFWPSRSRNIFVDQHYA